MKYRKLGKTSIKVSEIGLGTSQIGNIDGTLPGVKPITKAEAMRILETALDGGINFFDTSDGYGAAEELLGELPQEKKKQAFLATKAGLMDSGERCFSQDYLILQAENSLRKLKVEAIDLFQLNKPTDHAAFITQFYIPPRKSGISAHWSLVAFCYFIIFLYFFKYKF